MWWWSDFILYNMRGRIFWVLFWCGWTSKISSIYWITNMSWGIFFRACWTQFDKFHPLVTLYRFVYIRLPQALKANHSLSSPVQTNLNIYYPVSIQWQNTRLICNYDQNSLCDWTISVNNLEVILDKEFWENCNRCALRGWITWVNRFHCFLVSCLKSQTFKGNIYVFINTSMDCVLYTNQPKTIFFCFMFEQIKYMSSVL